MGMCVSTPTSPQVLDVRRSSNVHQLARTQSSVPSSADIPQSHEYNGAPADGQYNIHGLHQQTRRCQVIQPDDPGNSIMEVVPNARCDPHLRYREHHSGLRVPTNFHQNQW
ncbi:hypothetical protein RMATCC62417_11495 [Rhizopus microsporus]|nr:hypothetical protein RMATCC62417_11495 [Rhizopus microsporus]